MFDRRRLLRVTAAASLAGAFLRPLRVGAAGPARPRARARLFAGAATRAGQVAREAGLEIVLDPGFKTYWRHPGESGLPPALDWSGSDNLDAVAVRWPAPHRVADAAGVSYAYADSVVLPLDVVPRDPARPIAMALRLDYGVCRDICIPEHADLACTLPPGGTETRPTDLALIAAARRAVPVARPLGDAGTPAILSVARSGPDRLAVLARIDPGADAHLFVEMAEPWFLLADEAPLAASPGVARFEVAILQRPDTVAPLDVTLTLVNGPAVETGLRLDAALLTR